MTISDRMLDRQDDGPEARGFDVPWHTRPRPLALTVDALRAEEIRLKAELKRVRAHLRVEERIAIKAEVERERAQTR